MHKQSQTCYGVQCPLKFFFYYFFLNFIQFYSIFLLFFCTFGQLKDTYCEVQTLCAFFFILNCLFARLGLYFIVLQDIKLSWNSLRLVGDYNVVQPNMSSLGPCKLLHPWLQSLELVDSSATSNSGGQVLGVSIECESVSIHLTLCLPNLFWA